jgi:hypothetical protein
MLEPWIFLVDSDRQPYRDTSGAQITVPLGANVFALQKAIMSEFSPILAGIVASQLRTFKNRKAFDTEERHLSPDTMVAGLGASLDEALVILVPTTVLKSSTFSKGLILSDHVCKSGLCVCPAGPANVCLGLDKAHGHCDCCEAVHACVGVCRWRTVTVIAAGRCMHVLECVFINK